MIYYKKDMDYIVIFIFDMVGWDINIINYEVSCVFLFVIEYFWVEKQKGILRGVIIILVKKMFCIGGDLEYFFKMDDLEVIF